MYLGGRRQWIVDWFWVRNTSLCDVGVWNIHMISLHIIPCLGHFFPDPVVISGIAAGDFLEALGIPFSDFSSSLRPYLMSPDAGDHIGDRVKWRLEFCLLLSQKDAVAHLDVVDLDIGFIIFVELLFGLHDLFLLSGFLEDGLYIAAGGSSDVWKTRSEVVIEEHFSRGEACGRVGSRAVGHQGFVDLDIGVLALHNGSVVDFANDFVEPLHESVGLGIVRRDLDVGGTHPLQVLLELMSSDPIEGWTTIGSQTSWIAVSGEDVVKRDDVVFSRSALHHGDLRVSAGAVHYHQDVLPIWCWAPVVG